MATLHWKNSAGGSFDVASSWSGNAVPGMNDAALIDLVGTYTVTSAVANTVNTLAIISTATLDITAATFTVLSGSDVGGLAGTIKVEDGAALSLGDSIVNSGLISLLGTSATGAQLSINTTTVQLTGGGTIALSNDGSNVISGQGLNYFLDNVDNKIAGSGLIGNDTMGLINEKAGVIDADQAAGLVVNTGTDVIINTGTMEATAGGALTISSVVDNDSGTIEAVGAGSVVTLQAQVEGGVIASSAGGSVVFATNNLSLDGLGSHPVTNSTSLAVADGHTLYLAGRIINNGTLALNSTGDNTDMIATSAFVTLSGKGQVTLSNNGANRIYGSARTFTLDNASNTISGAGQLGIGQLTFVNGGIVDANQTDTLILNTSGEYATNTGTLEATGTGGLLIQNTVVVNTGGMVEATGSGDVVTLAGGDIQGGTLATSGGGMIATSGSGQIDGISAGTLANTGLLDVADLTTLYVTGIINNTGTILDNQASNSGNTDIVINGQTAELTGAGQVELSSNSDNRIYGSGASNTLINVNNTISGGGQLGTGQLTFVNDAAGVVDASSATTTLVVNTSGRLLVNLGLLEATSTVATAPGMLIQNTAVANAGGTVEGSNLGGVVSLSNSSIQGGTLATSKAGTIESVGGYVSLDGADAVPLTNTGLFEVVNGATLHLDGTIDNTGTLLDASTGSNSDIVMDTEFVTLTGAGHLTLSNNSVNRVYGGGAGNTLINVNNTISGAGQLGIGQMTFINQAAGLVDANFASALVVNTSGRLLTNNGLMEDTGKGGLVFQNTSVLNNATLLASGKGSNVDLSNSTIQGGTLSTSGGGAIETTGGYNQLDGAVWDNGSITNTGLVQVNDSTTLHLAGIIDNTGTFLDNSTGDNTDIIMDTQAVTLMGGGLVTLSNNGANRIYGGGAGNTLINVDNTISGAGQLGANQMTFVNEAKGVVDANQKATRTLAAQLILNTSGRLAMNQGLMEATSTGGLIIQSTAVVNSGTILATGAGATVSLSSSSIQGGTLKTASGGAIQTGGGYSSLDGITSGTILNTGLVRINDQQTLHLDGIIDNTGTILLDQTSATGNTDLIMDSQVVTLTGSGKVTLSASGSNRIYAGAGSSTLFNLNNTISGVGQLGAGQLTFTNAGMVNANSASGQIVVNLGGNVLTNMAAGVLLGSGSQGLALSNLILNNSGTVKASDGSSVVMATNVYNFNMEEGELSGGTWNATANGHGATLDMTGGPLVMDSANIILSGTGSIIASWNGNAYQDIATSLQTISSTGVLQVLGSRGYSSTLGLTDNGSLVLSGGTLQTASLMLGATTAMLSGSGTVHDAVANSGTVMAKGGLLDVTGAVTGSGALSIQNAATLELGGASAETVTFATGAVGMLKLDAPASFTGPIAGLALGDAIDFTGATVTGTPVVSSGTLTVTVAGKSLHFAVSGALTGNHFAVQSDGAGGDELVLTAGAAAVAGALANAAASQTSSAFSAGLLGGAALAHPAALPAVPAGAAALLAHAAEVSIGLPWLH